MFIIGLTGGIASGKSTVAAMLVEKGAYLIDADQLAREAVEPGQPAWQEIVDWLGKSVLLPDRNIDRARLADIVFNNQQELKKLNTIVHPRVGSRLLELSEKIKKDDPDAVVVYDIPLLIEAGMQKLVDLVLLVYVPRDTQILRLRQRDKLSRLEAEKRLGTQKPLEDKKKDADVIIDNSENLAETARQVDRFWSGLKNYQ